MIRRLPTRIDRYPGKMNRRLAHSVAEKFVASADSKIVLDPFCGSGALLAACMAPGRQMVGVDINPVAVLLTEVKLNGFNVDDFRTSVDGLIAFARRGGSPLEIDWYNKSYWFTSGVLDKLERLRFATLRIAERIPKREWNAVLLCLAMAVRGCSRADQRSPKPFISAIARAERKGKHFCPYKQLLRIREGLIAAHRGPRVIGCASDVILGDIVREDVLRDRKANCVVTSPPYLNAQDYFRNTKLELYLLEGLLPFRVADMRDRFVGTERGSVEKGLLEDHWYFVRDSVNNFSALENERRRLAAVVVKYFREMSVVFDQVVGCLGDEGKLVLICGDNLVGGIRIDTWKILDRMLVERGFLAVESFTDKIRDRMLAPRRSGHNGLIKEEVVTCYRKV